MYIIEYKDNGMDVRRRIEDNELSFYRRRYSDIIYKRLDNDISEECRYYCDHVLGLVSILRELCYVNGLENEGWYLDYLDKLNSFSL